MRSALSKKMPAAVNPKHLLYLALFLSGGWFANNCPAAIIYPKAPEGGREMVIQLANYFVGKNLPLFKGISTTNDLMVAAPCEGYSVGLTNMAAGELLSAAYTSHISWQYLILHGTNIVGWAFVRADVKTGRALKCYQIGEPLKGLDEALRIAEQLPEVKKQDYEMRYLDMPWILFDAVWLHAKSNDIIIPLRDHWSRWSAGRPYSETEMIKILKPIAEKQLKVKMMPGMVGS